MGFYAEVMVEESEWRDWRVLHLSERQWHRFRIKARLGTLGWRFLALGILTAHCIVLGWVADRFGRTVGGLHGHGWLMVGLVFGMVLSTFWGWLDEGGGAPLSGGSSCMAYRTRSDA
jgi:hypothetical protein